MAPIKSGETTLAGKHEAMPLRRYQEVPSRSYTHSIQSKLNKRWRAVQRCYLEKWSRVKQEQLRSSAQEGGGVGEGEGNCLTEISMW